MQSANGFHMNGGYYQNYSGLNEKWFQDRSNHWFVITPDGSVLPWTAGKSLASTPALATLSPAVFDNPALLFQAGGTLSTSLQDQLNQLQASNGFHFAGSYYQNYSGLNEKWFEDRNNQWFVLKPDGSLVSGSGNLATNPVLATLSPVVFDNPNLLFQAQGSLDPALVVSLAQFQASYGFHTVGSYYQNSTGFNEKWFKDQSGRWFALTPDGTLTLWSGSSFSTSLKVTTFSPAVYDNPNLLFNETSLSVAAPTGSAQGAITQATLAPLVAAAIQRWTDAGLTGAQVAALEEREDRCGRPAGRPIGHLGPRRNPD